MINQPKRIALFVTCVVDQLMPEVGVDTVKVLRRAGYEVDFPPEQTCCGQPFFNSGFQDEARRLARRTIDAFADREIVVLPSGSCTTMIRQEYPHLLENEPKYYYRALRLAKKSFELSEFLLKEAKWPEVTAVPTPQPQAQPITYHDSCHMCRLLGLKKEPRQTLQAAGYTIQEMAEPDRCCGFGGLFSVRMPEVSNAMTAEKLRQAQATQAATLVTADPGCLMQMRGLADGQPIEHIATMLERATR
jgi:L-lactate dehydrogenase complex protein LldE